MKLNLKEQLQKHVGTTLITSDNQFSTLVH